MAGRPSKPRHIKEAQGTLEKSREVDSPMSHAPLVRVPKIPAEVLDGGRDYFKFVCDSLIANGLLTASFIPSIIRASNWYAQYIESIEDIRDNGYFQETSTGYRAHTPAVSLQKEAHKSLTEFENQYGLNLVSSQKISVPDRSYNDFD